MSDLASITRELSDIGRLGEDKLRFILEHLIDPKGKKVDAGGNFEVALAVELDRYDHGILKVEGTDEYVPFEAVVLNTSGCEIAPWYSRYIKDRQENELVVIREDRSGQPHTITLDQIGNPIGGQQTG